MSQYGIENSYGIMLLGDTFALFDEPQSAGRNTKLRGPW